MQQIFKTVAGSNLFGTAVTTSDVDYKGVHMPDAKSIVLGTSESVIEQNTKQGTGKNTQDDEDFVSFAYRDYVRKLAKMEINAIEMLFAPNIVDTNGAPTWIDVLYNQRFKILSKNKAAFVGFAKNQAMKYAVRGDRLTTLTAVVQLLRSFSDLNGKAVQYIDQLQAMPNVKIEWKDSPGDVQVPFIDIFGREAPLTCKVAEVIAVYEKPIKEAGNRTIAATTTGGTDWKGLYHAMRVVDEGIELFSTGALVFPCKNADYYKAIRSGELELEDVLTTFEGRLKTLENLEPMEKFLEKPDMKWVDNHTATVYTGVVIKEFVPAA